MPNSCYAVHWQKDSLVNMPYKKQCKHTYPEGLTVEANKKGSPIYFTRSMD